MFRPAVIALDIASLLSFVVSRLRKNILLEDIAFDNDRILNFRTLVFKMQRTSSHVL